MQTAFLGVPHPDRVHKNNNKRKCCKASSGSKSLSGKSNLRFFFFFFLVRLLLLVPFWHQQLLLIFTIEISNDISSKARVQSNPGSWHDNIRDTVTVLFKSLVQNQWCLHIQCGKYLSAACSCIGISSTSVFTESFVFSYWTKDWGSCDMQN